MSTAEENNGTKNFDDVYRFRCFKALKRRAKRVAETRGHGDPSDIAREGVIKLVEAEEERLGLPPIDGGIKSAELQEAAA